MERIALIACTKKKRAVATEAGEMYMPSQLFRAARGYADRFADRFLILSAKHGPLAPTTVIEPYEASLKGASVAVKREWAGLVADQIAESLPSPCHIVMLAGKDYRSYLLTHVVRLGHSVSMPIPPSLRMGEQASWLRSQSEAQKAKS